MTTRLLQTMSETTDPSHLDWLFRILAAIGAAIGPVVAVTFGYILKTNANKFREIDIRQNETDDLVQQNRLDIKNAEISVKDLEIHITKNFCDKTDIQNSLGRVHEKIEDGNNKTEALADKMGNKIDELRRDIQADIRAAMQVALHQVPPVT